MVQRKEQTGHEPREQQDLHWGNLPLRRNDSLANWEPLEPKEHSQQGATPLVAAESAEPVPVRAEVQEMAAEVSVRSATGMGAWVAAALGRALLFRAEAGQCEPHQRKDRVLSPA